MGYSGGPILAQAAKMDSVFIRDLRVETVIGVYDWERRIRQTLILDVDMAADVARAAATDAIEDALDYSEVAKRIRQLGDEKAFQLVETFAEHTARLIRETFAVAWVRVKVTKPGAVPGASGVGVVIERGGRP